MHYFGDNVNKKLNNILAESNESSPYYVQFENKLNAYSDMDLSRITEEQAATMVQILLQGIANGEKKSQLTYAFMLLTGQFVEKDEELGEQLLSMLLLLAELVNTSNNTDAIRGEEQVLIEKYGQNYPRLNKN